jgi:hypothetical protein
VHLVVSEILVTDSDCFWLDKPAIAVRFPTETRNTVFSEVSRPTLELREPPIHRLVGALPGELSELSAEVTTNWCHTSTLAYAFMAYRDPTSHVPLHKTYLPAVSYGCGHL